MERKKWMAIILSVILIAVMLSGCGADGQEESGLHTQDVGRYVEEEQELPDEWDGWTAKQMFTCGDKIHLLMVKEEEDRLVLREWERQEEGFADVTRPWLGTVSLPAQEWMNLKLMQDGSGVQYLYAEYTGEEQIYQGHLWRSDDDAALDITPEKWTILNEWGYYETVSGIAALDNGILLANTALSLDTLNGEDGSILASEEILGEYAETVLSDGENIYLFKTENGVINQVEKRPGGKDTGEELIPFGQSSALGVSLCVMRDGTLISAGSDGIFRCKEGDDSWEKLLSGLDTDFSLSGCWCIGLAALEGGQIYALFQQESGEVMLKTYEYDPDAVTEVKETLKLFAVEESSLLQNAVALYHRNHPEVIIETEYAYSLDDKYSGVAYDYNEVSQRLNAMLMSDDAPDIIVMDHLDTDSFAEKGLLVDLNELLTDMEQKGELLTNITGSYIRDDGSRYIVPLQFVFTYITGRDIKASDMESLESLAAFLEGKEESYLGPQTVEELVDKFYPYFCDDIVTDKELDKETLKEKLEALKVVADNSGIVERHEDGNGQNGRCYGIWDLASRIKLALDDNTEGFWGCMFDVSITDYIKGDFTAFENSFIPVTEMGICTKSKYQDTARDFLKFALSEEVQDANYYSGFPVNTASLEKQAAEDRSDYSACTSIVGDDGVEEIFDILPYGEETTRKIMNICRAVSKPKREDAKIREALISSLGDYFNGGSLEDAVSKIEAELKMYLAE